MNMLRNLRERKGLTVSQLAARASIPARVLTDYEEGRQPIPLPHAKLIAKALWVQIEDLMPPAGSVPPPPAASAQPAASTSQPVYTARPQEPQQPRPIPSASAPPVLARREESAPAQPNRVREMPARTAATHDGQQGRPGAGGNAGAPRSTRPRSAPPPPSPISEGQVEELMRIAARLEIPQDQLEARLGKPVTELNRPEAKEWIKKLRAMADELAPSQKTRFGQWPEAREDREAGYLAEQKEAAEPFTFKLFNGEQFEGVITDFTPYTITIKPSGSEDEMVLRKLAIAYYRKAGAAPTAGGKTAKAAAKPRARSGAGKTVNPVPVGSEDAGPQPPPVDGLSTDRAGDPDVPELDNMDEDRGV